MRTRIAVAVTVALAGCAQPKPAVDTTPENPTAVFETVMSSTGIAGMFPFATTEKRWVRADMRREDQASKGTGRFTGFLVTRALRGGDGANIARLDRKVNWSLSHSRKEYFECPIQGCPVPAGAQETPQEQGGEAGRREEPRQQTEEGCVAKVASSNLDVKPTGQKRSLNGFDTEQYQVAWVVRLQDKEKRTTTSTVKFDIWTTPLNAEMRRAMDTETAFGRALTANLPRQDAAAMQPPAGVMPGEMLSMMTGYLTSLSPADRAAFTRGLRELDKIKGHPISTKTEWFLEGNACGAKDGEQQAQQQQQQPQSASAMLGQMAGRLLKKEEPATTGPKPLLSFTTEVKQLGVQPVRDSVFSVPASYKLVKMQ